MLAILVIEKKLGFGIKVNVISEYASNAEKHISMFTFRKGENLSLRKRC